MSEQFSTFDKLHKEVYSKLVLKHILHVNQERVIYSVKNVFFKLNVIHLVIF